MSTKTYNYDHIFYAILLFFAKALHMGEIF